MYMRLLVPLLLVAFLAISCDKSPEEEYCDDRDDLNESVDDLGSAVTSRNVDKIKESAKDVEDDIDELEQSAKALNGPAPSGLKSSFNELYTTIESLGQGGGGDLQSSIQMLAPAVSQFETTLDTYEQAYSCD